MTMLADVACFVELPDTRAGLLELARLEANGDWDVTSPACRADTIRIFAPALHGCSDDVVEERFAELVADYRMFRLAENDDLDWWEIVDDPREDVLQAAVARLDDTLAKLTTPTGATA